MLTLVFYLAEIITFISVYETWKYDIFWLNIIIRAVLVFFFAIAVRNIIFKGSKNFYIKFLGLIILNPLISSLSLKMLSIGYPLIEILILKILADLISSVLVFLTLKKIA